MHAVVTKVTVRDIPFFKESENRPWDLTSGPDLYYRSYDPHDELLCTSNVASDIRPHDLPVTLSGKFAIQALFGEYRIVLLDSDLTADDVICCIAFELGVLANDRPDTVSLNTEDVTLGLTLEWNE